MAATSSKASLKLLIDKKTKKVLFAEAGKETIDFLFSLLALPIATVIRLLGKQGMVGSLSNLYKSIESLKDDYVQPQLHKDTILKPMVQASMESGPSLFLPDNDAPKRKFYRCSNYNHYHVAYNPKTTCPTCFTVMNVELAIVEGGNVAVGAGASSGSGGGGGFVKGIVTYMVMDDLEVSPMSTITGITLLSKFNVLHVGDLEEKVVDLDKAKALKLLKASLFSKNVLTSVFL